MYDDGELRIVTDQQSRFHVEGIHIDYSNAESRSTASTRSRWKRPVNCSPEPARHRTGSGKP
jgi:hypothetical protein